MGVSLGCFYQKIKVIKYCRDILRRKKIFSWRSNWSVQNFVASWCLGRWMLAAPSSACVVLELQGSSPGRCKEVSSIRMRGMRNGLQRACLSLLWRPIPCAMSRSPVPTSCTTRYLGFQFDKWQDITMPLGLSLNVNQLRNWTPATLSTWWSVEELVSLNLNCLHRHSTRSSGPETQAIRLHSAHIQPSGH